MVEVTEKVLTVVVPSYNMEAYLPKCLGSLEVAPELMERLEVLVVNDGSKDRTSEIAHAFAAKWPNTFKVINKENGNYGSCINAALKVATGVYIKVLDADDWFDSAVFEGYLQRLAEEAVHQPQADLILNDFDFVDANGQPYRHVSYKYVEDAGLTLDSITFKGERVMWMHAVAYRTENLRRIGYRQTEGVSYTDQEWIGLPMSTVRKIVYVPGALYKYLNGREGQTCQPMTYAYGFPIQMKITKGLVTAYKSRYDAVPPENARYLRRHLEARLRTIYDKAVFSRIEGMEPGLRDFDAFLKVESPELYELTDQWTFSLIKFRHVHSWRRKRTNRTLQLSLFRTYYGYVQKIAKWVR